MGIFLSIKSYIAHETFCRQHYQCNFTTSLESSGFLKAFSFQKLRWDLNVLLRKKLKTKSWICRPRNELEEKVSLQQKFWRIVLMLYSKELTNKRVIPWSLKITKCHSFSIITKIFNKENYRPVCILSHRPKVFERLLYKQIDNFISSKFPPYLCGLRKNHNSHQSLLKMIEAWKKYLDKGDLDIVIVMDVSKAFDTINHSLPLTKLEANRFLLTSLKITQSYLRKPFQRTTINGSFSKLTEIKTRTPQVSVLGRLLFKIFLIFFFSKK